MTPRYFFVHCQKTAGTSLMSQLQVILGPENICPSESTKKADGPMSILSLNSLKRYLEIGGPDIRLVSGHFPYCTRDLIGPSWQTFTILRDPVERTLSFLRHVRKMTPELKTASLEEIYEDPIRFHGLIHNHMVKMFSLPLSPDLDTVMAHIEFNEDHLTTARQNLRQVDVIGLQEDYGSFCVRLKGRFGWDIDPNIRQNTTRTSETINPEFLRRIMQDNHLDIRFYKYAQKLIAQRAERRRKT